MKTYMKLLAGAALMSALQAHAAPMVNPGFELGNTSDWWPISTAGVPDTPITVVTGHAGDTTIPNYTAPEGSHFLEINTGDSVGSSQSVRQTFTLNVGETLNIARAFDWRDYAPFGQGDAVSVTLLNSQGIEVLGWADITAASLDDYADVPWQFNSFTATALTAGDYTLTLGVVNNPDGVVANYGLFDAWVTSIPEPSSLALLGVGLLAPVLARRRTKA